MTFEKQSKGIKGGKREGAGRKAGVPNKRTAELLVTVAEQGITPLEYMLQVMRDVSNEPKDRLSASVSAAPFVHAKLSAIEVSGNKDNPLNASLLIQYVAAVNPTP